MARKAKRPGFENINGDVEIDGLSHFQQKIAEKGAGGTPPNYGYARAVTQAEFLVIILDDRGE